MEKKNISDNFRCISCQRLATEPYVMSCCDTVVCQDCKANCSSGTCASCGNNNYQILTNSFVRKLASQTAVSCINGCGFSGSIQETKKHENECKRGKHKCKICNFSAAKDEFLCHINSSHIQIMIKQFDSQGQGNKPADAVWDPTLQLINSANVLSKKGTTSKYYCGKEIGFKCGCCTGCGPTNGDNCLPCMKLDVKSRNLPRGYLVNKFGATAIFKNNSFQCGCYISGKVQCDSKQQCKGCESLNRNQINYQSAAFE